MKLSECSTKELEVELLRRKQPRARQGWLTPRSVVNIQEAAENLIRVIAEHADTDIQESYEYTLVTEVLTAIYDEDIVEWIDLHRPRITP